MKDVAAEHALMLWRSKCTRISKMDAIAHATCVIMWMRSGGGPRSMLFVTMMRASGTMKPVTVASPGALNECQNVTLDRTGDDCVFRCPPVSLYP